VSALSRYEWPGNIRELRNALERALIVSRGVTIEPEHLPIELREKAAQPSPESARSLKRQERDHILQVLREANGNRTKAARLLGISRSTLNRKLSEMGEG